MSLVHSASISVIPVRKLPKFQNEANHSLFSTVAYDVPQMRKVRVCLQNSQPVSLAQITVVLVWTNGRGTHDHIAVTVWSQMRKSMNHSLK